MNAHARARKGYRPRWEDHFPATLRGHGAIRRGGCALASCRGDHRDQAENIREWKVERGLESPRKERPKSEHVTPYFGPESVLVWSTDPAMRHAVERTRQGRGF